MIAMPKQLSPEARMTGILQEQYALVQELKTAAPARRLQIQAEIVALSEEQSDLLQAAGGVNCFIFTNSSTRGAGWIEEERNYDGSVKQYRYGYYGNGKSNRRYLSKFLVADVQKMISAGARPAEIVEFLDLSKANKTKTLAASSQ